LVKIEDLREKWHMIPVPGCGNFDSRELLQLSDAIFGNMWLTANKHQREKYWYRQYYTKDFWKDRKVIDIGCGFCADSLSFAIRGANMIFADIVEENVEIAKRLCRIFKVDAEFLVIDSFKKLRELPKLSVVLALGSLHHAPIKMIKPEMQELCKHLKTGGRWLQLAYPYERWVACGSPSFERFGVMTDGEGTPWAEWYDANKLMDVLSPFKFDLQIETEFAKYHEYNQFIWFDLKKK